MALKSSKLASEMDLFRMELVNQINMRHALVKLAHVIDLKECESHFAPLYKAGIGRVACPICLMVGLEYLK